MLITGLKMPLVVLRSKDYCRFLYSNVIIAATHMLQDKLLKKPSALQYFSYMLNFHSVLAGPFFMFADYQDFIEGTHYAKRSLHHAKAKNSLDDNRNKSPADAKVIKPMKPEDEPNPFSVSILKASFSFMCAFVTVVLLPKFPISHLTGK
ncbi:hypothetical protein SK128_007375 [Halocaridina rubra]|uniref:Uncharacterized protein n=1 Tax=Halocaridina rubra TaxID=373956 RepID=A0AAN8XVN4_HALRR